ncbi:olfactomedin-4-like [Electrophorus electricus]|uniref:olfactomedin-4-like n=1 Tax=Electrophorus electricus TaxID=8005 RepID=UPI0015D03528|nr:olfactomedin-4-like [Electrophorus electricus]
MKSRWVIAVFLTFLCQSPWSVSGKGCVCQLKNSERPFPMEKLNGIQTLASTCNLSITPAKMFQVDVLQLGLQRRIEQLKVDMAVLEREDDGELYGTVTLRIIELELAEILELTNKLNRTACAHQQLSESTANQLRDMLDGMRELEDYDQMQVVTRQRDNQQMRQELIQCEQQLRATAQPPLTPKTGPCPLGQLVDVSGPRTYTLTQYGTSYSFGAWGKDPNPAPGKENTHWLVVLTSSNAFSNFVREYSTLSTIVVGVAPTDTTIASSNPTTNTIQGINVVMYGNALYYGCYNTPAVCRFNMTARTISNVALPQNTGFNNKFPFGHLEGTYVYSDLDFATDESGVWVVYTSPENFGNVIISEVLEGSPPALGRTWNTSLHKRMVTNTFIACGVLYATRFVNKETEQIFYSFDTQSGVERYNLKIFFKKMLTNIQSLNYNPRDRMLYAFSDAYILSYGTVFQ